MFIQPILYLITLLCVSLYLEWPQIKFGVAVVTVLLESIPHARHLHGAGAKILRIVFLTGESGDQQRWDFLSSLGNQLRADRYEPLAAFLTHRPDVEEVTASCTAE